MNGEIKEILEKIKNWCDLALDDNCNTIMYKYEFVAILDYITNLQESEAYYYGQYKDYKSRNEKAIDIAYEYSQIVRALTDDNYNEFVKKYENNGEYKWDIGIAP